MSFSALAIKIGYRVKADAILVFSAKSQGIKRFCLAQSCQEKTVVVG